MQWSIPKLHDVQIDRIVSLDKYLELYRWFALSLLCRYDSDMSNIATNREASKSQNSDIPEQRVLADDINLSQFDHRKSDKRSLFSAINQKVRI